MTEKTEISVFLIFVPFRLFVLFRNYLHRDISFRNLRKDRNLRKYFRNASVFSVCFCNTTSTVGFYYRKGRK